MVAINTLSEYMRTHSTPPFDYDLAVDWAIELMKLGDETENVLMLASFSKPVDSLEISPYLSSVLTDQGLGQVSGEEAKKMKAKFYALQILESNQIRYYLDLLTDFCMETNYNKELMPFYMLRHGWMELEEMGVNYYYDGVNLSNIERAIKHEAKVWLDKNA